MIAKYFQKSISKHSRICPNAECGLILISEALPKNIDDYFDGKDEPMFIKNTNTIFKQALKSNLTEVMENAGVK